MAKCTQCGGEVSCTGHSHQIGSAIQACPLAKGALWIQVVCGEDGLLDVDVFADEVKQKTDTLGLAAYDPLADGSHPVRISTTLPTALVKTHRPSSNPTASATVKTGAITLFKFHLERKQPKIVVATSQAFDVVPVGEKGARKIVIKNEGDGDLVIKGLTFPALFKEAADNAVKDGHVIGPGTSAEVALSFEPDAGGDKTGDLVIATNDASAASKTVALTGSAVLPVIEVLAEVDFAKVALNHKPQMKLVVKNVGTGELEIKALTFPTLFSAPGTSALKVGDKLGAGVSKELLIEHAPDTEGTKSANLVIGSNDPVSASKMVVLKSIVQKAKVTSIAFLDGTDTAELGAAGEQYVNLPRDVAWVDGTHVKNIDRLGEKPRLLVKFDLPGAHTVKVKLKPDGANVAYSAGEKGRSARFTYEETEKTYTTGADGTKIITDLFITVAGKHKYGAVAKDDQATEVTTAHQVEVQRLVYVQQVKMPGVPAATNITKLTAEMAAHNIKLVALADLAMEAMPNISMTDSNAFKTKVLTAYTGSTSTAMAKEPHVVALAYTGHLAVKDASQQIQKSAVAVGPGAAAVVLPIVNSSGDTKFLWKGLVPTEGWFVSATFLKNGGTSPADDVVIPEAKCTAVVSSSYGAGFHDSVSVDVTALGVNSAVTPPGAGTPPAVTVAGVPKGVYAGRVKVEVGGALGVATFKVSFDGGTAWSAVAPTAASHALVAQGLTLGFAAGTYVAGDTYTWTSGTQSGTLTLKVNWVNRMRGGLSFPGTNLICVCAQAWWTDISGDDQNQVAIHELGHTLGMVPLGTGTVPDKPTTQYTGLGHIGSHCHFGTPVSTTSYATASGTCVMFGATSSYTAFCANCAPAVKKLDFSAGWPRLT